MPVAAPKRFPSQFQTRRLLSPPQLLRAIILIFLLAAEQHPMLINGLTEAMHKINMGSEREHIA